jgi:outer membrane lipoprotein SlyB
MSRFQSDTYKEVLENPRKRYLLRGKEKPVWKTRINPAVLFLAFFLITALVLIAALLLFSIFTPEITPLYVLAWIAIFVGIIIFACVYNVKKRKEAIRKRKPVTLQQFISSTHLLQKYEAKYIRAVRHTLGALYNLNPDIIVPSDTRQSIEQIAGAPPLGFEVVLGAAKRINLDLSEQDVDRIVERIYRNSFCVEDIANVLCEELTMKANISNTQPTATCETSKKQVREHTFIDVKIIVGFTLLGALAALQGEFEKNRFLSGSSLVIAIISGAIAGFIIGVLICAIIKILNIKVKKWKSTEDEQKLTLEELRELADATPAKKYINCWIKCLSGANSGKLTVTESSSLPVPPDYKPEELPSFTEVLIKLRSMLKMGTAFCCTPKTKVLKLTIDGKEVDFGIEICDGAREAYITIQAIRPEEKKETYPRK